MRLLPLHLVGDAGLVEQGFKITNGLPGPGCRRRVRGIDGIRWAIVEADRQFWPWFCPKHGDPLPWCRSVYWRRLEGNRGWRGRSSWTGRRLSTQEPEPGTNPGAVPTGFDTDHY